MSVARITRYLSSACSLVVAGLLVPFSSIAAGHSPPTEDETIKWINERLAFAESTEIQCLGERIAAISRSTYLQIDGGKLQIVEVKKGQVIIGSPPEEFSTFQKRSVNRKELSLRIVYMGDKVEKLRFSDCTKVEDEQVALVSEFFIRCRFDDCIKNESGSSSGAILRARKFSDEQGSMLRALEHLLRIGGAKRPPPEKRLF